MKVCYFGFYNQNYSRNKILISGLKQNQVEVTECQSSLSGILKYFELVKKYWQIKNQYEVMVIGFRGQQAMFLAKLLCRKPIILDAFLSFYDSMVFDRKVCSPKSLKAKYYWWLDYLSCRLADKILLDTNEHINYFVETFKIKKEKFSRIFIGADDAIFKPRNLTKKTDQFLTHWHGTYIPLQGVEYIIGAADILRKENIKFRLIGSGQLFKQTQKQVIDLGLTAMVELIEFLPAEEIPQLIESADICLGIFGATPKAKRVIPNKVYECLAMAKPVITAESPASCEILIDYQHVLFCRLADAKSLAEKILEIKNNSDLRKKLGQNGYKFYRQNFCPAVLGQELKTIISQFNN